MRTFDRYVLREYLRLFLVITAGVVGLFIVVNFFEQIDKFVANKASLADVGKYYLYQIPYLVNLLSPVAALLATFFSLGEFAMRRELLAIKAAGVPVWRTFFPILGVGALATAYGLWANQGLVPDGLRKAREIRAYKILKRKTARARTYGERISFFGEGGRLYYFRRIDARRNAAWGIVVLELEGNRVVRRIDARRGRYDSVWTFYGVVEREFLPDGSVRFARHSRKVYPEVKERPFDFLKSPKEIAETNTPELLRRIKVLKRAGLEFYQELVELQVRFSFPFMNLIILLFALPIAAGMRGASRAWGFGISIMVAFFYWALLQATRTLGDVGRLDPTLSAWIPNITFVLFSIPGFLRLRT